MPWEVYLWLALCPASGHQELNIFVPALDHGLRPLTLRVKLNFSVKVQVPGISFQQWES